MQGAQAHIVLLALHTCIVVVGAHVVRRLLPIMASLQLVVEV